MVILRFNRRAIIALSCQGFVVGQHFEELWHLLDYFQLNLLQFVLFLTYPWLIRKYWQLVLRVRTAYDFDLGNLTHHHLLVDRLHQEVLMLVILPWDLKSAAEVVEKGTWRTEERRFVLTRR